jgi:hypothetical protein
MANVLVGRGTKVRCRYVARAADFAAPLDLSRWRGGGGDRVLNGTSPRHRPNEEARERDGGERRANLT